MKKILYAILAVLFLCNCKAERNSYDLRTDFRFNSRFYSILSNRDGKAYVVKGDDRNGGEGALKPINCDTSMVFYSDSLKQIYLDLNKIKAKPISDSYKTHDAPRIEIFHDGQKIYDSARWDEKFLSVYRKVITELPGGYNPFLINDNPFE